MTPLAAIYTAVHTHLVDTLDSPVGDLTAPNPAPTLYHVIELPPGAIFDGGLTCPEQRRYVTVNVRTVAKNTDPTVARQAALDHADRADAAMLDRTTPISGAGWTVAARQQTSDSGALIEGPVVNVVRSYRLMVAAA